MERLSSTATASVAAIAAGGMIAAQIAAKSVRDALFLTEIGVQALPVMVVVAAIAGVATVFPIGQLMQRYSPWRVMPIAFALSGALLMVEWLIARANPGLGGILLYLHFAALGAVIISGFWTAISERFNAQRARGLITRISTGATLGGLVGGVMADRIAEWASPLVVIPVVAGLHVICAGLVWMARPRRGDVGFTAAPRLVDASWFEGLDAVRGVSYLRNLALLVALSTAAAVMLDYVFKDAAVAAYSSEAELMQFFARFYAAVGVLTFIVQAVASRWILERWGIAQSIGLMPVLVSCGVVVGLFVPGLLPLSLSRGGEAVLRSSTFKSGYELVFTPIPPREKRTAKAVIDVGFDRLGDVIGAGVVQLLLFIPGLPVSRLLLFFCLLAMFAMIGVTRRLQAGYVKALESGLRSRAIELEMNDVLDSTTRSTVLRSLGSMDMEGVLGRDTPRESDATERGDSGGGGDVPRTERKGGSLASTSSYRDATILELVAMLRSRDPAEVRKGLKSVDEHGRWFASPLIALLAWDEVAGDVILVLRRMAPRISGQLLDSLLDEGESFAIRRRIPRVLVDCDSQKVVDGLVEALEQDRRFEVRYGCSRVLQRMKRRNSSLRVPRKRLLSVVESELEVDPRVWSRRRLLDDELDELEADSARKPVFMGDVRARSSLEHVFNLLSLVYDPDPLRIAWEGLSHEDKALKGLAMEYLDSILSEKLRDKLWPFLETMEEASPARSSPGRTADDIIVEMTATWESIRSDDG